MKLFGISRRVISASSIISLLPLLLMNSCSDFSSTPKNQEIETLKSRSELKKELKTDGYLPQQIAGFVYFEDGTLLKSWNPIYYARAYYDYDLENPVPGSEDEIDPNLGHYGCSGDDSDWPTGTYLIKTDVVTRNGSQFSGRKWVYHTYAVSTLADITLYPHPSFSQIDGVVAFEDGTKPAGSPSLYIYLYGDLFATTTIPSNGTYSFEAIPEDWPTRTYFAETDVIYKRGIAYWDGIYIEHEQFQRTKDQNIVLLRLESRPSN